MNYRTKAVASVAAALATLVLSSAAMAQTTPPATTPPPAGKAGDNVRQLPEISLDLKNAPIRDVLAKFFDQAKVDYALDDSVQGHVTLKVTDQPFENVLRLLYRSNSVPLTNVSDNGIFIIRARVLQNNENSSSVPVASPAGEAAKPTPPAPAAKAEDKAPENKAPVEQKVSLDLHDTPIREALEKLFRQTKSDFSMDNAVQGYVTLKITDQPLETALRMLLRTAPMPLTYSKEDGVYIIKPRRIAQSSEAGAPSLLLQTASRTNSASPSASALIADQDGNRLLAVTSGFDGGQQTDIIPLMYLDPADVADLLNIIQIPSFTRQTGTGTTGTGQGRTGQTSAGGAGLAPKGTTIITSD